MQLDAALNNKAVWWKSSEATCISPVQFFCDWCRPCSVCVCVWCVCVHRDTQFLPYELPQSIHLEWLLLTFIFILPFLFQEPLIRKGQPCREWYKPQSMSPWVPIPLLYLLCNDRIFSINTVSLSPVCIQFTKNRVQLLDEVILMVFSPHQTCKYMYQFGGYEWHKVGENRIKILLFEGKAQSSYIEITRDWTNSKYLK